jgi:pimeloyl-ACP methyl ester carboxylesterase
MRTLKPTSKFALASLLALSALRVEAAEPIELSVPGGTLYGTLEMPDANGQENRGPYPVALFLSGSGAANRDGDNLFGGGESDALRLLAEALAQRGIASVRFDKRGVAASSAAATREDELRFETYVSDAVAWGRRLREDKRFASLTLIGHSEGAMIGMAAASQLKADAFVSLAGPGRKLGVILQEQLQPILSPALLAQARSIINSLEAGQTVGTVAPELTSLFRPSVQPYLISVARIDPVAQIRDFSIPTLLVQGTTDLQVKTGDAKALAAAQPKAKMALIPGMNHVLKMVAGRRLGTDALVPRPLATSADHAHQAGDALHLDPNAPA